MCLFDQTCLFDKTCTSPKLSGIAMNSKGGNRPEAPNDDNLQHVSLDRLVVGNHTKGQLLTGRKMAIMFALTTVQTYLSVSFS